MRVFLSKILPVFDSWWKVIFLLFTFLIIYLVIEFFKNHLKSKNKYKKIFDNLFNHKFFYKIDYWATEDNLSKFDIKNLGKKELVKDTLKWKFIISNEVFKNGLRELKLMKKPTMDCLENFWFKLIDKTITLFEYKLKELGQPDLWIKKFSKYHKRTSLKFIINNIKNITVSDYFKDKTEFSEAVLILLLTGYQQAMMDAEYTLKDLNGELAGFKYKGYTLK